MMAGLNDFVSRATGLALIRNIGDCYTGIIHFSALAIGYFRTQSGAHTVRCRACVKPCLQCAARARKPRYVDTLVT